MELLEAIKCRRSIRTYADRKIKGEVLSHLQNFIDLTNRESGLNFQLILNEPKAFDCLLSKIGRFSNVRNYIAAIGKKGPDLEENCGYFGEKIVLEAQRIGLNTCWVGGTYKKIHKFFSLRPDDKVVLVIAIGYGVPKELKPRPTKKLPDVVSDSDPKPSWFINGVDAALRAPTAMNRQNFKFSLVGDRVACKPGRGSFTAVDLGIVKYHFEIGSGKDHRIWLS